LVNKSLGFDTGPLLEQQCEIPWRRAQGFLDVLQRDEQGLVQGIAAEEKELGRELVDARKFIERMESQYVEPNAFVRFLRSFGIGK